MQDRVTPQGIRLRYPDDGYVAFHAPRYATLLTLLDEYIRPESAVLDIGRSALTEMLHQRFRVPIDALGFLDDEVTQEGNNWWYDLNFAAERGSWRSDLPTYDVIVMAEVIEHLYVSPLSVLSFLRTLLRPAGVLIIQTPNAVALHKRIEMLAGRNPFEEIREERNNPGHFREYTRRELEDVVRSAGLRVESWRSDAYLDYRYVQHDAASPNRNALILNAVYKLMPPSLRPGQTLIARQPPST